MHIQRPQPMSEQVLSLLRKRIREKEYEPQDRLPSESELAAELGVSRATVRSALSALAAERLIVRRQGDGTYVNRRFLDTTTHFGAISEFTSMIASSGYEPTIRGLRVETRPATPHEAQVLEIPLNSTVLILVRLFLADDKPAIYSDDAIPTSLLGRTLDLKQIEEPLPKFFRQYCSQEFTYGISELVAEEGPAEVAAVLGTTPGAPLLRLNEVFYNDQDQPLVCARNYIHHQVFPLKVARSFNG